MINHPANSLIACACAALIALAFLLTTLGIKAIGDYQSSRMFRRLGAAAARKAAESADEGDPALDAELQALLTNHQDGDQK